MAEIGGIVRVSSKAQAVESDSPANQRQVLAAQGATRFYEDVGSGFSLKRRRGSESWQQLIADIKAGRLTRLLATDISRAARRDALLSELIELCDANGVEFLAAGMAMSHGSAHQWYSAKQLGLVAELYSRDLSDRIRRGRDAALARGVPAFTSKHLPWHLMREPGTRHGVIPNPERWDDARQAVMQYIDGKARLDHISAWIYAKHGVMAHPSGVHKWLRSMALEGHYGTREGRLILANCFPALITAEEGVLLRRRLEANRKRWGTKSNHTVYALTGVCRCLHCERALSYTCTRRPDGSQLQYLRCSAKRECPGFRMVVNALQVEEALLWRVDNALVARQAAAVSQTVVVSPEVVALRKRISALEALLADLDTPGVRGDLSQAKERLAALEDAAGGETALTDQAKELLMRGVNAWMDREPSQRNADWLLLLEKAMVDTTYKVTGGGWEARLVPQVLLR